MLIALPAALGGLATHLWANMGGGPKRVAVIFPSELEPCAEAGWKACGCVWRAPNW